MNILKVKTLICFQNQKEQWNVTNLAVTLGEEKYAVSRVLTVLEKEGLIKVIGENRYLRKRERWRRKRTVRK